MALRLRRLVRCGAVLVPVVVVAVPVDVRVLDAVEVPVPMRVRIVRFGVVVIVALLLHPRGFPYRRAQPILGKLGMGCAADSL